MATYLTMYKDGKEAATLWPSHNYELHMEDVAEVKSCLLAALLSITISRATRDEDCHELIREYIESVDHAIDSAIRIGQRKVLDSLEEEDNGFEFREE